MFEGALILDAKGKQVTQHHKTHSADWDEVRTFCTSVYMPYSVRPLGRFPHPNASMYSAKVGRITATRFCYGVPVHLQDFDPGPGNILVLTTLQGKLRHGIDSNDSTVTCAGESFVADCSKTDYWLDGDKHHLQLNLTVPHKIMEETALRWFDFIPDDRLWKAKLKFGGKGSAWVSLLDFMVKAIAEMPDRAESGRIAAHLQETLCVGLLSIWARKAGVDLEHGARFAAPHYVRRAEAYMEENARSRPTLTEVASAVGVSVRALSGAFIRFRNMTPMAFLREQRLRGARKELLDANGSATVSDVAGNWGYVNFGIFAKSYQQRFGELPSATLRRARHWCGACFPAI